MLIRSDEKYDVINTDCIVHMMEEMEPKSVDLLICSPPFPSMFSYSSSPADLGNIEDLESEVWLNFLWFFKGVARVMKPGRVALIDCMNIPKLSRHNRDGTFDFRGLNIRAGVRAGLIYDNEWMCWKNPQREAIRTHSHRLLFVTLERDRVKSGAAFPGYIIKFLAQGDNVVPIDSPGITRDDWIKWADPCWHDITFTNNLNIKEAKSSDDVRHICPFDLRLVNRLIRLFSNPGEVVFDPFTGIGSVGYECMKLDRCFYGCELKPEYHACALRNLDRACKAVAEDSRNLLDIMEENGETDGEADGGVCDEVCEAVYDQDEVEVE